MKKLLCIGLVLLVSSYSQGQTLTDFEEKLMEFRYGFYLEFARAEDSVDVVPSRMLDILNNAVITEKIKKFMEENQAEIAKYQINQLLRFEKTPFSLKKTDFSTESTLVDLSELSLYLSESYLNYLQIEPLNFLDYIIQMHLSRALTTTEYAGYALKNNLARGRVHSTKLDAQNIQVTIDRYDWLVEGIFDINKSAFSEVRIYKARH